MDMVRRYIVFLLFACLPVFLLSQNLIPNPGFESHSSCTDDAFVYSSLENTSNWFNLDTPLSTADWFSSCYQPGSTYKTPSTYWGTSFPRNGDAMAGFGPYFTQTGKGEIFGVQMAQPMVKDSAYCLSFWIRNSQFQGYNYILREFCAAFVVDTSGLGLDVFPNSYGTLSNTDENGWTELSTYYISTGNEQFFLIGNFSASPDYYLEPPSPGFGEEKYMYYFVDDVSVYPCSRDSLFEVVLELPNVFSPNGDLQNDTYKLKLKNITKLEVIIINRWGNTVKILNGLTIEWDGTDQNGDPVTEGVYFVRASAETTFGEHLYDQQVVQIFR